MHSFVRFSPRCFPAKVWRRTSGGYTQVAATEQDLIRREAMASWMLGYCSLDKALQTIAHTQELDKLLIESKRNALRALAEQQRDEQERASGVCV